MYRHLLRTQVQSVLAPRLSTGFLSRSFANGVPVGKDQIKVNKKTGELECTFGKPFRTHKCDGPQNKGVTNKDELLKFYREMYLVRRTEVACDNAYKAKLIRGFLHLYNGQEAITTGTEAALTKEDHIITAYRCHGHYLVRGGSVKELMAELMMKTTGCSKGKGGSMHLYDKKHNFHGGNGIVGAQTPIGAGLAFGCKYSGNKNVALTYYGDGAANQGQLFEAFNMASLWKLPCIFICENNKFGMGTAMERASADTHYYRRGDYVPGVWVDAMNVLAVREAVRYAAEWGRAGKGPMVLEMETYRYMGHSMSDPGLTYRTREDVAAVRSERDPIDKVKNWLLENSFATEYDIKAINQEVQKEVDEAVQFAKDSPMPASNELYTDVYGYKPYFARAVELPASVVIQ